MVKLKSLIRQHRFLHIILATDLVMSDTNQNKILLPVDNNSITLGTIMSNLLKTDSKKKTNGGSTIAESALDVESRNTKK